jgi:hypothetical protein
LGAGLERQGGGEPARGSQEKRICQSRPGLVLETIPFHNGEFSQAALFAGCTSLVAPPSSTFAHHTNTKLFNMTRFTRRFARTT